jgi:uncharacterized protein (DUF3820 family)
MKRVPAAEMPRMVRQAKGIEMPFGKHAGRALGDLPTGYRRWCLKTLENARSELRAALALSLGEQPADHPRPEPSSTTRTSRPRDPADVVNLDMGGDPLAEMLAAMPPTDNPFHH